MNLLNLCTSIEWVNKYIVEDEKQLSHCGRSKLQIRKGRSLEWFLWCCVKVGSLTQTHEYIHIKNR